ncbi:MAG: pimeloyl-CoA dehydrogenase large subunit, partial [Cellvibrionales bacterium]
MNTDYSVDELQFMGQVREWFEANLPADLKRKCELGVPLNKDDYVSWGRILNSNGWAAISWPEEYGGAGWTATQKHIFEQVSYETGAPLVYESGVGMLGPVLLEFGSEAQKARYLPRILNFDDFFVLVDGEEVDFDE